MRKCTLLSILLASLMFLPCELSAEAAKKDTLVVVLSSDPANLDPNSSDSQYHYQATRQIYETLFVYDEKYQIAPWLCESYEYQGNDTLILHIRKGVKFHNGDELKASDVLFTFRRILTNKLSGMVEVSNVLIDKCQVLNDYTLKLVTRGPVATQIALLENPASSIMSERAYTEANGNFFKGACVGTGPYQFVSYAAGDQMVMKAFDGYWRKGEPHIKNLVMRFITDSTSRAVEAETGGADIVYDINPKDLAVVDAAKGVSIVSDLGTNTSHLLFNTALKPMDNILVRQAIWYAVDAKAAVSMAYRNFGSFASGWVCPGINGYDPDLAPKYFPKRDVKKAKQLLAKAGYPKGLSLRIAVSNSSKERCDMAEVFQAQLAEAGIDLKLDVMENSTWNTYILEGKAQMTIYGFSAADFEADRALVQFMPDNSNYKLCSFDNKKFQDTVRKSFVTMDNNQRFQLYRDAATMLMENYVTLPLWHKALCAAVKDDVGGFKITRSYEHHYLQYVYFK